MKCHIFHHYVINVNIKNEMLRESLHKLSIYSIMDGECIDNRVVMRSN